MGDLADIEFAVRQLHARYADAVWRLDFDAFGACFTEDAEWRMDGNFFRNRAEIVGHLKYLSGVFRRIFMTFRTPLIAITNGNVTSRTYITENNVFLDGKSGSLIGIYFDRFVGRGPDMKFSWRLFQTHYWGPADLTEPLFEQPDFGPPPQMPPLNAETQPPKPISTKAYTER